MDLLLEKWEYGQVGAAEHNQKTSLQGEGGAEIRGSLPGWSCHGSELEQVEDVPC